MRLLRSPSILFTVLTALCLACSAPLDASIVMKIDTVNDTFYFEGTDSGTPIDFGFGSYDLQFKVNLSTHPSESQNITPTPHQLFSPALSGGNMNMIRNTSGGSYIFIDLYSNTNFSTLTGLGSTATASYAGLSATNQAIFESLVGQSMGLTIGSGFSPIAIQAVPEPATLALFAGLATVAACSLRRRRAA
ncbi:MAG: hypothetical protein RL648_531 [Verrucomicrobiota bacterium]